MIRILFLFVIVIGVLLASISGVILLYHKHQPALISKREVERKHLQEIANQLAEQKTKDGWFIRVKGFGEVDLWGHPIRVRYERDTSGWGEYLRVESTGPDGLWATNDDVGATVVLVNQHERKRLTGR